MLSFLLWRNARLYVATLKGSLLKEVPPAKSGYESKISRRSRRFAGENAGRCLKCLRSVVGIYGARFGKNIRPLSRASTFVPSPTPGWPQVS